MYFTASRTEEDEQNNSIGSALHLLAVTVCVWFFLLSASSMTAAAPGQVAESNNDAQTQLMEQQNSLREQTNRETQGVKSNRIFVPVESVVVNSDNLSEEAVKRLVPEVNKKILSVRQLSKQIQLANESGAMELGANIRRGTQGEYVITVTAKEKQSQHGSITVSNTGNDNSGNWRVTTSYVNGSLTDRADTFGMAYVTSPSGGHLGDVRQAVMSYRMPLPKLGDAVNIYASYSDVDLGTVANLGNGLEYTASGRGTNAGAHYQHNISYTSREKDIIDIGVDYKRLSNNYGLELNSQSLVKMNQEYDTLSGSLSFIHNDRDERHSFTYNAGLQTSLGKAGSNFDLNASGYDEHYWLAKAGASYQYRFGKDWLLGVRLQGQYTNKNLLPALQIGAGGFGSVRGFMERAIAADKGIVGSLELYTPEFAKGSRFLLFLDGARLANNNKMSYFDKETIASWGVGYRYNDPKKHMTIAIDYADIISDVNEDLKQQHKRWNAMVSWAF